MPNDFCFILDSFHHETPNQLGNKPFYLLFRHSSGTVGDVIDLDDAMKRARIHAQANRYEYVVMKAVAIIRPAPTQLEEIMLDDNNAS